jgi:uncharacterized membrane protein
MSLFKADFKMTPRRTTLDWTLEVISLAILVSIFVNLAAHWAELPDRVPRHYGALGDPNAWGGKSGLWALPVVAVGLYLLLTAASRYQRLINLPVRVDRDLPAVRKLLLTMAIWMKATIMLMFAYISWAGINTALGRTQGLGRMFLPLFLAATFAPVIFFTRKLQRYRV